MQPCADPVRILDYDPAWPLKFQAEAAKIQAALGDRALDVHHVGSTSVPGLPAKPVIDIALVVADSSRETSYAAALEQAGYELRIREPEWFEHRLFKPSDNSVNLHVFSQGCEEIGRMLLFRDWLRSNESDRNLYARVKRELAQRDWKLVQDYADAKTEVVQQIMSRAVFSRGERML
jgi:GrpB-like predicted nucleotidyltransferase (UPF0157 family)